MKKALALILALLMLCSSVAIVASATEEPKDEAYWENVTNNLGMNVYVGAPMETSPVLDGVISEGEYSASVYNAPSDILNYGNKITSGGLTEYFAHDEEWVYYAIKYESTSGGVAFMWQYKPFNSFDVFNPAGDDSYFYTRISWQARYNTGYADKYRYWNTDYTGSWAPSMTASKRAPYIHANMPSAEYEEHHCAAGLADGYAVFEAKVAKSYFAYAGDCSVEDVVVVPYFTYLHSADAVGTVYTNEQIAALTEAGAEFLPAAGTLGYKFMVLDDDMNHGAAAPEVDYWESVTNDLGMNIYVGAPMETSPVLDGVISEGEYSKSVYNEPSDILNYGNKITDGGLTEYFAHDSEWVYYAVKYKSTSQGVAFMWQYKPFNSFDIFNPSGDDNYFYNRLSWQARYSTSYADKYRYWNTDYTGSWAPSFTNACSIRAPYIHKNAPSPEYEEHHCAAGLADGYAVFEVKVAKSYFAFAGNCSTEDVVVVPYFLYLHSADGIGTIYTADQIAALTEAGAAFLPSEGGLGYKFMVLDDDMYHETNDKEDEEVKEPLTPAELADELGLTIKVQPVAKAPVLDGVISENEYPTSRTLNVADLFNGDGDGEVQGETVTEYFGHDGEYVYYAATFTQSQSSVRAFWPQFKCDNTFDIFNANYTQRATYQARWSVDPETGRNVSYVNGIGNQAGFDTPVNGVDITFWAERDDSNVKTYEFKFAKNFFATQNGISYDEVQVIPYYTYFHASCAIGATLTGEQVAMILEAGKVAPAAGQPNYYFMVLEGETTKIEDRITITTNETASIRLSAANPGLRFKSNVNAADLATLVTKFGAENVKVGTLITLDSLRDGGAITADAAYTVVDVKASINDPFKAGTTNVYAGSITSIKPANLTKDFAAVGYIAYRTSADAEWTYIYSEVTAVRNVTYVAQACYDAGEFADSPAAIKILKDLGAVEA